MKKIIIAALAALIIMPAGAAKKKEAETNKNKPVFTTIKENKITSVKDQSRSGTCWNFSTLSYFESEAFKATGKEFDLCESFVCNKTYMERAIQTVRFHGDCQFSQGGSAEDVLQTLKAHGICPQDAMPF
ncbi:MAG: aminopeptidase, partial [Bacteroidaceae bacterium]|nr:aminopeptidase [Bacteroidaceae bacterium]